MLWNSLSSARAGLKTPGAGTWHSATLTLSWAWLGRVQLCLGRIQLWFVVLPYSRCSVKSLGRALFSACPPHSAPVSVLQYQGSLGSGRGWQRPDVLQQHCGAVPRQISWENPLLGAADLWLSPGGWCSLAGVTWKQHLLTLWNTRCLSLFTLICKLGCDKTN